MLKSLKPKGSCYCVSCRTVNFSSWHLSWLYLSHLHMGVPSLSARWEFQSTRKCSMFLKCTLWGHTACGVSISSYPLKEREAPNHPDVISCSKMNPNVTKHPIFERKVEYFVEQIFSSPAIHQNQLAVLPVFQGYIVGRLKLLLTCFMVQSTRVTTSWNSSCGRFVCQHVGVQDVTEWQTNYLFMTSLILV